MKTVQIGCDNINIAVLVNWYLMRIALDIDDYPAVTDPLHPVKLQILLYLAQGYYLAMYQARLIDEDVTTNQYGPCFQSVLHKYGAQPFIDTTPNDEMLKDYETLEKIPDVSSILNMVYDSFGNTSAFDLIDMAKYQDPWLKTVAANNITVDNVNDGFFIGDNLMFEYFSSI